MTVLFREPLCYYHLVCEECGTTGLCSTCAELWESEIDLEDTEAEEEQKQEKGECAGAFIIPLEL